MFVELFFLESLEARWVHRPEVSSEALFAVLGHEQNAERFLALDGRCKTRLMNDWAQGQGALLLVLLALFIDSRLRLLQEEYPYCSLIAHSYA